MVPIAESRAATAAIDASNNANLFIPAEKGVIIDSGCEWKEIPGGYDA